MNNKFFQTIEQYYHNIGNNPPEVEVKIEKKWDKFTALPKKLKFLMRAEEVKDEYSTVGRRAKKKL